MRSIRDGFDTRAAEKGIVEIRRLPLRARDYRAIGDVFHAQPGSIEHFLAERYCLYTADEKGHVIRCEIHHPPWSLQLAEATLAGKYNGGCGCESRSAEK